MYDVDLTILYSQFIQKEIWKPYKINNQTSLPKKEFQKLNPVQTQSKTP